LHKQSRKAEESDSHPENRVGKRWKKALKWEMQESCGLKYGEKFVLDDGRERESEFKSLFFLR